MSAAFQLDFSGDPLPCDFPGCIRDSYHDGEHEFAPKKNPSIGKSREDFHRCAVCGQHFTIYSGSSAFNNWRTCSSGCLLILAMRESWQVSLRCNCPQRPYPHELSVHANIRSEKPGRYIVYGNSRGDPFADDFAEFSTPEMRWPWSLTLSPRSEPSTERKA